MLDFKNSIWRLISSKTISYVMSTVDLKVNRSQYKHVLHKSCIKIVQLNVYKSQGLKWVYLFNKIQQKIYNITIIVRLIYMYNNNTIYYPLANKVAKG